MPSSCGYTWSDPLDRVIRAESDQAGVPLDLAYTLIAAESGFDPTTHVDNALEDSVGLLELNRRGGQGAGYSVQQLQDPTTNLRIGLPPIRRAFEQAWSANVEPFEFIYQVATRSGHPGPVNRNDLRIHRIATIWACFYPAVGGSLLGPTPSAGAVSGPATILSAAVSVPILVLTAILELVYGTPHELFKEFSGAARLQELLHIPHLPRAARLAGFQLPAFPTATELLRGELRHEIERRERRRRKRRA